MENNLLYIGLLVIVAILSFLWGQFCGSTKNSFKEEKKNIEEKYLEQYNDIERKPIWDIVRYHENGEYDCVWSRGHTKREADKRCAKLNTDYHKNYGIYVVEING